MDIKYEIKYKKQLFITPSICDFSARIGFSDTFDLFMDIAAEHAEALGIGSAETAKRGLFWLTVRTRIRFINRPKMMSSVTAVTWPARPSRARCNRFYTLSDADGNLCIEGKTEWAMLDVASKKLFDTRLIYPEGLEMTDEEVCEGKFTRFASDFSDAEEIARVTVSSGDIDLGGHMNNVAYIRKLLNIFSTEDIKNMKIREMEIAFLNSCYEGDELRVLRRTSDDHTELIMLRADEKAAAILRII